MTKWEYKILDSKEIGDGNIFRGTNAAEVEEHLNTLGKEGWEIVNLDFNELANHFSFVGVAKRIIE